MDIRFNAYKVKFDMLDYLTLPIFKSQELRTVNMFISLDDVYWHCRNGQANREFQCCGNIAPKQLVSNVLNLMAHYREWLARKNVNVRVFAYYSTSSIFEMKTLMHDYRASYNKRNDVANADCYYVNTCIRESAGILKTITQYIEGAYVIDTRGMEPAAFPYVCATKFKEYEADWNFLVTKDIVEFQYAYYEKFSVIYPKGEYSKVLDTPAMWEHVAHKEKVESQYLYKYPDVFFPVALAIVGDKKRSIPKVKGLGWRTIMSMMDDIIAENPGLDGYSYTMKFLDNMEQKKYNMETIQGNLDIIQPKSSAMMTSEVAIENIHIQFIDIPDYNSLNDLNRNPDMFALCPINIRFLTRQNDVKAISPFKLTF